MMKKNKTTENEFSVTSFLNMVTDGTKREDCFKLLMIITETTGFNAKMWGTAIVGFGSYHYRYESGREGDAPLAGFSPRKNAIVLYVSAEFKDREKLLVKFGKHKTGKACIYIKKISDVDTAVLKEMIINSVASINRAYP